MQNVTFANCMSVLRNTCELNTAFLHQVLHDDHDDLIFSTQEKQYNGNLCWDWTCHGVCICYCPRSLSWLDGLLPFPVFLIIVGWLVRRCCRKNLQRFFFENPLLRHTSILLHCGISFTYVYVLISFFNEEYLRQQWFLFWIFGTFWFNLFKITRYGFLWLDSFL